MISARFGTSRCARPSRTRWLAARPVSRAGGIPGCAPPSPSAPRRSRTGARSTCLLDPLGAAARRQSRRLAEVRPVDDGFIEFAVDVARRGSGAAQVASRQGQGRSPANDGFACWSAATCRTTCRSLQQIKHRDPARHRRHGRARARRRPGHEPLDAEPPGARQPLDHADHGRRFRPAHRDRGQRRRVRRAGPEPERYAGADRAPAGRHAAGQRGHRPRPAHALEPDALADRGGADGCAATAEDARDLLEETLQDADG